MDGLRNRYPRPLMAALRVALKDTPVICVLGARQVGKTTLVQGLGARFGYLSLDDAATLAFANDDPTGFVQALPARAIVDEVQRAPGLLRSIKLVVDRDRRPGRLVLTGSANLLLLPQIGDSLAGRMEVITLQPLTAAEVARHKGAFLAALINGNLKPSLGASTEASPQTLATRIVVGGFPEAVRRRPARAGTWHRQYLRSVVERDVRDIARVRDVNGVARLLEVLALRTAQLLNVSSLGSDLGLRRETVDHYLDILERLYLARRLPAWHPNEARRLVKTPKVHIVDTGLASTLTGLTSADWNAQRDRFGHLLESFVVQQLIAQAGWTDPDLKFWHYRDKDQVEVDLVITRGRETWGVEVKSAATALPDDSKGLRRLAEIGGKDFKGGVLFYAGSDTLPLDVTGCVAAPLARLWDM